MPLTVGTAGHIDHGKTWLVRALTGKDTDRLPEEKERGISIDLGYAPLELPDGRRLSVIDVPGHERFVRNMVAGASGHRPLPARDRRDRGRTAADARAPGDPPAARDRGRRRRRDQGRRGRHGHARARASTRRASSSPGARGDPRERQDRRGARRAPRGAGLGCGGSRALDACSARLGSTSTASFTLRGIGTVVTGTLWSGSVGEGDELRAEPAGAEVRVRSVQVHDEPVERADAGQRVALALPGIERTALRRGDALVEPGSYPRQLPRRRPARGARADRRPRPAPCPSRHGRDPGPARANRRSLRAAPPRRAGRRGARRPRRPAQRDDGRRRPRPRPGSSAELGLVATRAPRRRTIPRRSCGRS